MMAFLMGATTAVVLATLTFFAMQAGTVAMTERFDTPNLHLDDNQMAE